MLTVLLTGVGPTDIVRRDTAVPMTNSYDIRALGSSFTADVYRDKYFKSCQPSGGNMCCSPSPGKDTL
jgi:hypothetical protein